MEPLLHFVLPFVALTLLGVEVRRAAALGFLGVVADLDSLLLIHRSLSHSAVVWGLLFLPVLIASWVRRRDACRWVALGFLVAVSHPLLDLGGYTPVFWPLYSYSLMVRFALNWRYSDTAVGLAPMFEVSQTPSSFDRVGHIDYPLFTQEGAFITLILLLPIIYRQVKNRQGIRVASAEVS